VTKTLAYLINKLGRICIYIYIYIYIERERERERERNKDRRIGRKWDSVIGRKRRIDMV
jgi:hypothetical protein